MSLEVINLCNFSVLKIKRYFYICLLVVAVVIGIQLLSSSWPQKNEYNSTIQFEAKKLRFQLQYSSSKSTPKPFLSALDLSAEYRNKQPPAYADLKALGDCKLSGNRFELYNVLLWWMKFAAVHNITWFLTYGSLLGQFRHKDIIPYDTDMDVGVLLDRNKEDLLRYVQTPRNQLLSNKPNLVIRPNGFCKFKSKERQRRDCDGIYRHKMTDECTFCQPFGRVIYGRYYYLDLFYYHKETGGETIFDEGMSPYRDNAVRNASLFFPIEDCTFIGLTVPCPKEKERLFELFLYGDLKPHMKCK